MRLRVWVPARACPRTQDPGDCLRAPDGCGLCPLRLLPSTARVEHATAGPAGMCSTLWIPDRAAAADVLRGLRAAGEPCFLVWGLPGPHPERPLLAHGVFWSIPPDAVGDALR